MNYMDTYYISQAPELLDTSTHNEHFNKIGIVLWLTSVSKLNIHITER